MVILKKSRGNFKLSGVKTSLMTALIITMSIAIFSYMSKLDEMIKP